MTIESLAHRIYVAAQTESDMKVWIKEYLDQRDAAVIGNPENDYSKILSPAQSAAVRILLHGQIDEAKSFDDGPAR